MSPSAGVPAQHQLSPATGDRQAEPVVWPDPSPVGDWWEEVMGMRGRTGPGNRCAADPAEAS
ncbi:hypothetical protein [Nocardia sp. X0981]